MTSPRLPAIRLPVVVVAAGAVVDMGGGTLCFVCKSAISRRILHKRDGRSSYHEANLLAVLRKYSDVSSFETGRQRSRDRISFDQFAEQLRELAGLFCR